MKSIFDDPPAEEAAGWAHGQIGNDLIEDLGSGYNWLTGGDGDDIIISGQLSGHCFMVIGSPPTTLLKGWIPLLLSAVVTLKLWIGSLVRMFGGCPSGRR